ncbi:MAG: aldo/keto reductase [Chitinophagales bacterium]|nr:aldo/keto reductase [Chitinophagales bacterium]
MEYKRLGNSGLPVSILSFGSWLTFGQQIDDSVAEKCMKIAYDHGINFFDNAEVYARGESEKVMGKILKNMNWNRDSYMVSSKVFFGTGNLPTQKGLHRKHIMEACHAAMKRLKVNYLDLFFCHRPDPQTPIEETVWAMHSLIQQGKVFYWGTSEWSAEQIIEAHTVAEKHHLMAPTMEQPQYNMLHRQRFEAEYAPLYERYGMGTTIWSPLASGILTGKYNNSKPGSTRLFMKGLEWLKEQKLNDENVLGKIKLLSAFALEIGIRMPHLAIGWCLKNSNVSTVILGASKTSQLKENLDALEILPKLTDDVMARIETILQNKP